MGGYIMGKRIIKNATIVTGDDNRRVIKQGAVVIEGHKIVAVGKTAKLEHLYRDFEVYNGTDKAVFPGFINSHTHTVLTVLRGSVEDMDADAVYGFMTPISFAMTPDERAAMAQLGCLEAIRSGTTTLVDPFRHVVGYVPAMADSGLRLFFSENVTDVLTLKIRSGVYEHDRAWGEEFLDRTIQLVERFHNTSDGRVQCQIAAHAPDNCSPWILRRLLDLAEKYQLRRTVHLAQSLGEVNQTRHLRGCTPAEYLHQNDWLAPDLVAAHWTFCTQKDIDLLGETGTHMAHCPANSSRRGPHRALMNRILDNGVNVALGSDNMTEDLFHAMKIGLIIYRGSYGGGVKPAPQLLLDGITRNGALALAREPDLGSIEPGKRADLTVINLNSAHLRPIFNLTSNIVHYGHPGCVDAVMVDGKFLMCDSKILSMNEADVIQNAQTAANGAWQRFKDMYPDVSMPSGH